MITLEKATGGTTVIRSTATGVDPTAKTVTMADGKVIPYDVLVVATGSRNLSPGEPPVSVTDKKGTSAYYETMRQALTKTKSVVIVGTGAVGVELAGEIHEFGQKGVKITLVGRAPQILTESFKYKEGGIQRIMDDLHKLGVEVLNGEEVTSHPMPENVKDASPLVPTPQGVTLKSGRKIDSDLLVFAAGSKINSSFLPVNWVDQTTHDLIVDTKTLQLKANKSVFCVGDVAKVESPKRGYFANEDAKVVAANVVQVLKGQEPTHKIQRMAMAIITLGSHGGRMLLPFGTLGPRTTRLVKSKGLFTKGMWGSFASGVAVPPV